MFSILIGLVSTQNRDRIFETLQALRQQTGDHSYEVIIADRCNDYISEQIDSDYPEVKRLPCPADTPLTVLRTLALNLASGEYIVVTEDHCVPTPDWLTSFQQVFVKAPENTVAVAGCVENGVTDSALDWATFYCEYSHFMAPVLEGITAPLAGMNIAYRRSVFTDLEADILTSGFWETTLHPLLQQQGWQLLSSNEIKIMHSKKFSLRLFMTQRFIYSRYYAARRFGAEMTARKILAILATPLLPLILLNRMISSLRQKQRLDRNFFRALPILGVFLLVWALGEIVGYIAGAGNALEKIE